MLLGPAAGCSAPGGSPQAVVKSVSDIERGSSHDPSIVEANGKYYIFGSHRAWLKSDDLVNWEPFTNNLSTQFKDILGDFWEEWPKQSRLCIPVYRITCCSCKHLQIHP